VHIRFTISGGALWYHLDQTIESWSGGTISARAAFHRCRMSATSIASAATRSSPTPASIGKKGATRRSQPSSKPLDDASFLYWIRTVPLEVGKRYEYAR